jgi:hypothetical protein
MITSVTYPDEYSFAGNPMIVAFTGDTAEEVIFRVEADGIDLLDISIFLFKVGNEYKGSTDISGILLSAFKKNNYQTDAIISLLENFYVKYSITLENFQKYEGKAFYGGITGKNYSQLKSLGMNMFSYRLRNPERQFLFTTRTNTSHLVLRETELYPFVFIHPGKAISVITAAGKLFIPESFPADTVCTFDIQALRKMIFFTYNELSSFFSIMVDGRHIFDITLIPNQASDNVFFLRFKNSLGAFEIVEVPGTSTDTLTFSEEESWLSVNQYNFFAENRKRVSSKKHIEAHAGYKSKNELSFIFDLIKSDEIYFIDPKDGLGNEYRCHVTPEELKLPRRMTEPDTIPLKIRLVSEDSFESPEITLEQVDLIFENITASGRPEIAGNGFIFAEDFAFYAE